MWTPEQGEREDAINEQKYPKPKCKKGMCNNDCRAFNDGFCLAHSPSVCEVAKGEEEEKLISSIDTRWDDFMMKFVFNEENVKDFIYKELKNQKKYLLDICNSSPTEPKKTVENMCNIHGKINCHYCSTPIQTGNDDGNWEDEYLRTTKRAILKVGENSPASQYLVNVVEEQIDKFIQKAVLQERESIKKLLQKECLDYCLAQNGYDYCKNCGLSLDLLDNKQ